MHMFYTPMLWFIIIKKRYFYFSWLCLAPLDISLIFLFFNLYYLSTDNRQAPSVLVLGYSCHWKDSPRNPTPGDLCLCPQVLPCMELSPLWSSSHIVSVATLCQWMGPNVWGAWWREETSPGEWLTQNTPRNFICPVVKWDRPSPQSVSWLNFNFWCFPHGCQGVSGVWL